MAQFTEHGIRLSSMCPTFLNSNSTSHTWPFSAIAELIDNAADPGVFAKQIWINTHEEAGQLCMTFTDNGGGMTPNKLHKMLSFGFTDKGRGQTSVQAIGVYGNGFKSGSMRLGRDALIFTKNGGCQSVGMLSQTYLESIKSQCVVVPIAPFIQQTNSLVVTADSEASLAAILQHSILSTKEQIQAHFDSISTKKGTKILIWNLRRAKDGSPEIDFESDPSDFRLPQIQIHELKKNMKNSGSLRAEQTIPDMHYSLRAYLSILYLRPRIHINLRGREIPLKLVSEQLAHVEYDVYKPHFNKDKVKVLFGVHENNPEHYGIMMYHKNRLIKAHEKVGGQLKTSGPRAGVGVIGIIECDFLKPAHNKQDFEYTKEYRLTLDALGMKLNNYWKEIMDRKAKQQEEAAKEQSEAAHKDKSDKAPVWLQCEECLKWRSVPAGHYQITPVTWTCSRNPNPRYRSCSSPEEIDDNEDLPASSYKRTLHKRDSKQREKSSKAAKSASSKDSLRRFSAVVLSRVDLAEPAEPSARTGRQGAARPEVGRGQGPGAASASPNGRVISESALTVTQTVTEPSPQRHEEVTEMSSEQEEQEEAVDPLSIKRKLEKLLEFGGKRRRLLDEQVSTEKGSNPRAPDADVGDSQEYNRDVAPASKPPDDSGEARVKKPEEPEAERHKLRQLLGPEATSISQLSSATVATNTESVREKEAVPTREIGCQTEATERSVSCSSNNLAPNLQEATVQDSDAMEGIQESELDTLRKEKNDSSRSSGNKDHNARTMQDKLISIRNNVITLLTVLLPQLDLAGLSVETSDVDNILQQIIEVNALKL